MADQVNGGGGGVPPWKVRIAGEGPDQESPTTEKEERAEAKKARVAQDVIELTHQQEDEANSVKFTKTNFRSAIASKGRAEIQDGELQIGTDTFQLSSAQQQGMTLLEPNKQTITGLQAGIESGRPTLISAMPGSGASYTARWFLDATDETHAYSKISQSTPLEELAGSLKTDDEGNIKVFLGPLAKCVRDGGTFVLDGFEKAEPKVRAAILSLVKGSKVFHPPQSAPIPVNENFNLVLIADRRKKVDSEIVRKSNVVEVDAYSEKDHEKLLISRFGLPDALASKLATFHSRIEEKAQEAQIGFGRGFPISWPILERVGARLKGARGGAPTDSSVARALNGLYGARIRQDAYRAHFKEVMDGIGLGDETPPPVKMSTDPTFVHTDRVDRVLSLSEDALRAGEAVLLNGPGQCGTTRLVYELARRRDQDVSCVLGHGGSDISMMTEMPTFDERGRLFFRPGRVSEALAEGKLLYVDHFDRMPRDQQSAFLQLQERGTIPVLEDGKIVEKPIHKDARIVFSTTEGRARGRNAPLAEDRAAVTEVQIDPIELEELAEHQSAEVIEDLDLSVLVDRVIKQLHEEDPKAGATKLQRYIDFGRVAKLLCAHMPRENAALHALNLVFNRTEGQTFDDLQAQADRTGYKHDGKQLWMKLLDLSAADVKKVEKDSGFKISESINPPLDAMAIGFSLGRGIRQVGPPSTGKTVNGSIFAGLLKRSKVRVNFSAATEARDLMGGLGPVNIDGQTVFKHIDGPVMSAAAASELVGEDYVVIGDEQNLSPLGMLSMKSALDFRQVLIDSEGGKEVSFSSTFYIGAENPTDTKIGRFEPPPETSDCLFTVWVGEKEVSEKAEIVQANTELDDGLVENIAYFYKDLQMIVGRLESMTAPLTCTERDMIKVAKTAEHFIARDKIKDADGQRKIVGREAVRLVRDMLENTTERDSVVQLVKKHFGDDIELPGQTRGFETFSKMVPAKEQMLLEVGGKEYPINSEFWVPQVLERIARAQHKAKVASDPDGDHVFDLEAAVAELEKGSKLTTKTIAAHDGQFLRIGKGEYPINDLTDFPELAEKVPDLKGVWPPVGEQFEFLESVMMALELNQPMAVIGNTGTGKTMLLRWLANKLQIPFVEQAFHGDMTEDHIYGTTVVSKDGTVEFQYGPLPGAIKGGVWYNGDEPTTLENDVRETMNPVTEGTQIQISQKRPPEVIEKKDWHPDFRYSVTANGDEIREDGFSEAEASRSRNLLLRELEELTSLQEIALRDYAAGDSTFEYEAPKRTAETREAAASAILGLLDGRSQVGKFLTAALAEATDQEGEGVSADDYAAIDTFPQLELDDAGVRAFADAYNVFTYSRKDGLVVDALNDLVANLASNGAASKILSHAPDETLSAAAFEKASLESVVDGRLSDPSELVRATEFFHELRDLQRAAAHEGLTPLTTRVFTGFLDLLVARRQGHSLAFAADRATRLQLWPKLPKNLQKRVDDLMMKHFGSMSDPERENLDKYDAPNRRKTGIRFNDTFVRYGGLAPIRPSNERFPLTPARCKNLSLIADARELGKGRPISVVDDENGEAVETFREFDRLTGRQTTVITLPPNVDIESTIEKLKLSNDEEAAKTGGFVPELQAIAQAVKDGHTLILRGCGNIPSTKLERLNSLGDGRQGLKLPLSPDSWLDAHDDFQLVMMSAADSTHRYSAALENRLLTPPLTTQESDVTRAALERKAAELAAVVRERCGISEESANKLGFFHTILNQILRGGEVFASSLAVKTFLNRDAEAVGRRLKTLLDRGVVDDEADMLVNLVMDVYGERFGSEDDRKLLRERAILAFQAAGRDVVLGAELQPSPQLTRVGQWALERDVRGEREGVPSAAEMLPQTQSLDAVLQKAAAASHFGEVLHLAGNEFIGDATYKTLGRLTSRTVESIEGNEELNEAFLFGGLVQNEKTGEWEEHEGVAWKAHREGSILVIRNASKLPPEVTTRLMEIAATGVMTRVKDGEIESHRPNFQLAIQTGENESLQHEFGSLCTRIRCPDVEDPEDLKILISHQLRGVHGAQQIAEMLEGFIADTTTMVEQESKSNRQALEFDGVRALEAARQISDGVINHGGSLEDVIADVLGRLFAVPVRGMDVEGDVHDAIERVADGLSGNLQMEVVDAIDIVANPEVGALRQDYGKVSAGLATASLEVAEDALNGVIESRNIAKAKAALTQLSSTKLLPLKITQRAERLLESLAGRRVGDEDAAELERLVRYFGRFKNDETGFKDSALEFVRSARVWDLEYRLAILDHYQELYQGLAAAGSDSAQQLAADVAEVRDRFDATDAHEKLHAAREAVTLATEQFKQTQGDIDPELEDIYRRITNTWGLVTTAPIFRSHVIPELQDLQRALAELDDFGKHAPNRRRITKLSESFRMASETLEGIRIAEQAADFTRGIKRISQNAQTLVADFKTEVEEIERLENAKSTHEHLSGAMSLVNRATLEDQFLRMDLGSESVDRPDQKSSKEIKAQAQKQANAILEKEQIAFEAEMYQELAALGRSAARPNVDDFFADHDSTQADAGFTPNGEATESNAVRELYRAKVAEYGTKFESREAELVAEFEQELTAKEERRAEGVYQAKVKNQAQLLAAKVNRSSGELASVFEKLDQSLEFSKNDPELFQDIKQCHEELREAARQAEQWSRGFVSSLGNMGRALWHGATFNMFKSRAEAEVPELNVEDTKRNAYELLKRIERHIQGRMDVLPDFETLNDHKDRTRTLTEDMMAADTLGDLAAKFTKLESIEETEQDDRITKHLRTVLNRMAGGRKVKEVLRKVSAFCESAELLSDAAKDGGIAVDLGPAVDGVMRAAEALRSQAIVDAQTSRTGLNALDRGLARIDELAGGQALPDVLIAVQAEMKELRETLLEVLGDRSGSVETGADGFAEMLDAIADRAVSSDAPEFALQDALEEHEKENAEGTSELDRAFERALARAQIPVDEPGEEQFDRATRLRVVEVEFGRAQLIQQLEDDEEDELGGPLASSAARDRIFAVAEAVEDSVEDGSGPLRRAKNRLLELIGELDESTKTGTIEHWLGEAAEAGARVDALIDAAGKGYRGVSREFSRSLSQFRTCAAGLRSLDYVPIEIASAMDALVLGAQDVAAAASTDRFYGAVRAWSGNAKVVAEEAQAVLTEARAGIIGEEDQQEISARVLGDLESELDTLTSNTQRVGAYSKLNILASIRGRLVASKDMLPDQQKASAESLVTRAEDLAASLLTRSLGETGETAAIESLDAFIDLSSLLSRKPDFGPNADEKAFETLDQLERLGGSLMQFFGKDMRTLDEDVELLDDAILLSDTIDTGLGNIKGERPSRKLSTSLGKIRSDLMRRTLKSRVNDVRRLAGDYFGPIRSAKMEINEAADAFFNYDPLGGKELPEVVRDLKNAISSGHEAMKGPASASTAKALVKFGERLDELAAENQPTSAEARGLFGEMTPILRDARVAAEHTTAPARVLAMVDRFEQRTDNALDSRIGKDLMAWARSAAEALEALFGFEGDAVTAEIDRVEREFFPELARVQPTGEDDEDEESAAIGSRVRELLKRDNQESPDEDGLVGTRESKVNLNLSAAKSNFEGTTPGNDFHGPGNVGSSLPDVVNPEAVGGIAEHAPAVSRTDDLGKVTRAALPEDGAMGPIDAPKAVRVSGTSKYKEMFEKMAEASHEAVAVDEGQAILTEFETFIAQNEDLVNEFASTLRQFPDLETVIAIDQSGSTGKTYGDSRILDQERAAAAVIMAAHMRAERNCAVVSFSGRVPAGAIAVKEHAGIGLLKPMSAPINIASLDSAYRGMSYHNGGTPIIPALEVALGQFTSDKNNNKMIHVLTDANLGGSARTVRGQIDGCRANGVGVAVQGFGEAQHVRAVAGEFGEHFSNYASAIQGARDLFMKAVVANNGRYAGFEEAGAAGIGVSENQAPLESAPGEGPMEQALRISEPVINLGHASEVYAGSGPRREMANLVDQAKYDRAEAVLKNTQRAAAKTAQFKECLTQIKAMNRRHARDGVLESLTEAVSMSLPKTRGTEWERKQLHGPLFDEQQLPLYVAGVRQGIPVMRIFKRRKQTEDTKATVVLAFDESSSMGDTPETRANLEALLAYGDALKQADENVKIAVIGYSDKVRLHAGFDQDWGDELKAHLLNQMKGHYNATDDERGALEAIGLLRLMDSDVGQVVSFSDGQGMPGTKKVIQNAAKEGIAHLTIGVGPKCSAVKTFGNHGLHVDNLSQLSNKLPGANLRVWEAAGRLVG